MVVQNEQFIGAHSQISCLNKFSDRDEQIIGTQSHGYAYHLTTSWGRWGRPNQEYLKWWCA
jgi:hypothetical protein